MAEPMYEPEKVEIVPDGLHIVWKDGLDSLLPHRHLRGHCGCAECVDESTHVRHVGVDDVPADVTIVLVYEGMGRYVAAAQASPEPDLAALFQEHELNRSGKHVQPAPNSSRTSPRCCPSPLRTWMAWTAPSTPLRRVIPEPSLKRRWSAQLVRYRVRPPRFVSLPSIPCGLRYATI